MANSIEPPERNRKKLKIALKPGDCVSVDIMQNSVDGFVPQQKGSILTTSCFVGAVIFVDHKTDFIFAVPITSLMAEEMVRAKQQFELFADKCGVKIQHYHADNGTFAAKLYMDSCKRANQGLTFCSVNAHHQNGRAEKRIQDLCESTRSTLLHAMHRWPKAIHLALWPMALLYITK